MSFEVSLAEEIWTAKYRYESPDGDGDDSSPRHCATSSTSPYRQPSSGSAQHPLRRDWLNVPRCQRKISLCARGATRSTCIVNGIDDVPVGGTPGTT